MPTDARLILAGRPQVNTGPPLAETLGQIADIRKSQADAQEQAIIQQIYRESPTEEEAIKRLRQSGRIDRANKDETGLLGRRKLGYENAKSAIEADTAHVVLGSRILSAALDNPRVYKHARQLFGNLVANNPDGQAIFSQLPEEYDEANSPGQLTALVRGAETVEQAAKRKQQDLENIFGKDPITGVASALSNASSDQDWDETMTIAEAAGVGDAARAMFGDKFSPEAAKRAAQMTISAKDKATLEDTDLTREQTAKTAEANRQVTIRGQDMTAATARRGQDLIDKRAGTTVGAPDGKVKLSVGQQDDITTANDVIGLIDEAERLGRAVGWRGVGTGFTGSIAKMTKNVAGYGSDESEQLRNTIGNLAGTIAKLRGGTSFTATEKELLDTYVPNINDGDATIRTKIKGLREFLERRKANILRTASGSAADIMGDTGNKQTSGSVSVGQIVPLNGKNHRITKVYPDGTFDAEIVR